MKEAKAQLQHSYPHIVTLANNSSVTLRLMTPFDVERILIFARSLPVDDLLFLRTDITDPEVVTQWVQSVAAGLAITIIAQVGSEVAGYATLHHNEVTWQRHIGEIRIQVGQRYRSQGLGRILASEVFSVGRELGLRKIVAQMTSDQKGAIATFEHLGFQTEALLQDFVIDRMDRTRDLLVMSYDVTGFTTHVN